MVHRRIVLLVALGSLILVLGNLGVSPTEARAAFPPSPAPSVGSQGLDVSTQTGAFPRYDLQIDVDTGARVLRGHMRLQFTNRTGAALGDVVLRLYPNFPRDVLGSGGDSRMDIANVRAGGAAVSPSYEAGRTAARIPLPGAAQPGAGIEIELDWSATFQPWLRGDNAFPLPSYYPMLAAWTGAWRTDVTRFPDHVFAASAAYHATITVPSGLTVIASGSTVGRRQEGGKSVFEVVAEPVREFAFSVGGFAAARASHAGIAVNVYHRSGDGMDGVAQQTALYAAASLATFNERFGAYPYGELDIQLIRSGQSYAAGAEYPGLIFIFANSRYNADTRYVTAHEVAHQWWYGVVGDDIYREPWIDEGFAQWSALLVEERVGGAATAERVYQQQIVRRARQTKTPCGLSLGAFGSWSNYYYSVYGRCGQFLYTLRRELGDDAFFRGIQRYYANNKFGIGTTAEVRVALEASSGRDLGAMFREWTGR
jgi:hypothetical protein